MGEMGMRNTHQIPPVLLCIMGGIMGFTLLASFTGLDHVADEMMLMGGLFGAILFLSGGYDMALSETSKSGSSWE